jgi:transglutaminase-like putative cysteine protease
MSRRNACVRVSRLCLVVLCLPLPGAAREIWAESLIAGGRAGYYHEAATTGQQETVTSIENHLIFNRMGSKVEMKSDSQYRESEAGALLAIHSEISSSAQSTAMDVTVRKQSLAIRTTSGGKAYDRVLEFAGDVLGPEAARRLVVQRLKSPGDVLSYQMYAPELGSVVTITDTLAAVEGHALHVEQTVSAMPGKTLVWLDAAGWLLRQVTPTPFGDIETVRTSDKTIGTRPMEGASLPAESFTNTLVTSNIRLPEERLIEQLKIRITHKKPELGWPDFTATGQTVLEKAPDHLLLEMRRVSTEARGAGMAQPADRELKQYLHPNALLQSDDANIRSIAAKVAGGDRDAYRVARALQRWTSENMRFDLGIAVAPASEVARDRRGTCLGYAVLLGSLARAAGVPSRVRMGFVYAGGIWGGHAWVDVLAGDEWIPLDAALYSPGPADAARFSVFSSSLQEGAIADVGSLARLYGNVEIQILEYTIHGKKVTVPEDARPFSISSDTYRNPWIGLTVTKPPSFTFTALHAVWPESTVVAMEGPGNRKVEIQSHSESLPVSGEGAEAELLRDAKIEGTRTEMEVNGHRAVAIFSATGAGVVLEQRGNLFLVKSTGPGAIDLLKEVASTLRIQ